MDLKVRFSNKETKQFKTDYLVQVLETEDEALIRQLQTSYLKNFLLKYKPPNFLNELLTNYGCFLHITIKDCNTLRVLQEEIGCLTCGVNERIKIV